MSTVTPDKYLTIQGVVELLPSLGIAATERSVRRWADEDRLPFFKFEGIRYVEVDAVKAYLRSLQAEAVKRLSKRGR